MDKMRCYFNSIIRVTNVPGISVNLKNPEQVMSIIRLGLEVRLEINNHTFSLQMDDGEILKQEWNSIEFVDCITISDEEAIGIISEAFAERDNYTATREERKNATRRR